VSRSLVSKAAVFWHVCHEFDEALSANTNFSSFCCFTGYAYSDGSDGDEENSNSGSGSNDHSGSGDDSNREGYWIVRNQWSSNWGMNGYAYVAMGANTCGILNDMTQAYM